MAKRRVGSPGGVGRDADPAGLEPDEPADALLEVVPGGPQAPGTRSGSAARSVSQYRPCSTSTTAEWLSDRDSTANPVARVVGDHEVVEQGTLGQHQQRDDQPLALGAQLVTVELELRPRLQVDVPPDDREDLLEPQPVLVVGQHPEEQHGRALGMTPLEPAQPFVDLLRRGQVGRAAPDGEQGRPRGAARQRPPRPDGEVAPGEQDAGEHGQRQPREKIPGRGEAARDVAAGVQVVEEREGVVDEGGAEERDPGQPEEHRRDGQEAALSHLRPSRRVNRFGGQ